KTGGTTLHHILMRGFDEDEICPERFNGLQHYSAGDLARYRYFSGHFDLLSVSLIPGEKKIITMLREPISRLISLYYFQREHKAETIERNNLELARLANAYTMKEFFEAKEVRMHPGINNALTRTLVGHFDSYRWEQGASSYSGDMEHHAQAAIRELTKLDAFGLLDRYNESVELICDAVGLDVPQLIEKKQVLDVVMEEEPGLRKIEREPVTDEILHLIRGVVRTDLKVYFHAQRLFKQRLAARARVNTKARKRLHG